MRAWRLDGKPRIARQFSVYKNCPLPTPEDRLFFILAQFIAVCSASILAEKQHMSSLLSI
jgi:hypothetical protein